MEWSNYNYLYYSKRAKCHLLYSSLSNMLIKLDSDDYKKIITIKNNPNIIDINNDCFKILLDGKFIIESNKNETNKIMLSTLIKRFDSNSLSLTIAPTHACNFNCPYCYEKNISNNKMSIEVQNGIIDFVKNKYKNINFLNIVWYGGEPSLEINIIKYLSIELQKISNNYNAFMITNGFRLDKMINFINILKIKGLQITLDGTRDTHDTTRCLKNGKGTYDKILSNINSVLKKIPNINISIRMNISKENSYQYVLLYHELKEKFGQKVHLYPAFIRDYGGGCISGSCYEDGIMKAEFLKNIFYQHGVYTKDIYPVRTSKGCMRQQMNAFVIGSEGELYKCWHHLGIDNKKVGSIFEQPTITNYSLLSNIMINEDVILDDRCKSCVLFPSCYGGCIDDKIRNKDYCTPAKSMLDDFLDIHYIAKTYSNKS